MSDDVRETPRTNRWIKPLLVASLALNLAVAGMLAGATWRHSTGDGVGKERGPAMGAYGVPYMKALPRETRRDVFEQVRKGGGQALPDRATRRAHFDAVITALQTRPFDEVVLRRALTTQASTTVQVQERIQTAWLTVVAAMSDAQRTAYAAEVKATLRRGPRRK